MTKYLILVLLISLPGKAQNYLWPTNSSTYMASSFCEFREGHYHSAIDIKTWVREGYPCYAVENGRIERIRISPFGYGKVLYLRLNDGNIAVYAHLQKFTKKIEAKIRQIQERNQKYSVSWRPKNWTVKKGDVIAYTGRTGIGVPHLHFEIRDSGDHPLNPLKFYPQVKDRIRPRLKSLAVIPLSEKGTINGSYLPLKFDLTYIREGIHVIKNPLLVRGEIGFALRGFDQADDVANKYGFFETSLEVDGSEVFNIAYKRMSFSTTAHIYTEIFYPFWIADREVYHKLYIEPFNPLPFYKKFSGENGSIYIKDKPRLFTVTVRDFHGNTSIVRGEIVPDDRTQISVEELTREGRNISLSFSSPPLSELELSAGSGRDNLKQIEYFELQRVLSENPGEHTRTRFTLEDSTSRYIAISAKSRSKQSLRKIIALEDSISGKPQLHFWNNKLIVSADPDWEGAAVRAGSGRKEYRLSDLGGGDIQAIIPGDDLILNSSPLTIEKTGRKIWQDSLTIVRFNTGKKTQRSWFDSSFVVVMPSQALNEPVLATASVCDTDSLVKHTPLASRIFELHPDNVPLFQSMTVRILADSLPAWGNWHIYKTNGTSKLSFLAAKRLADSNYLETRTREIGKYVIAADTVAPVIEIRSPAPGKSYNGPPKIFANVSDELSGIGDEDDIRMLLDGEFILAEWDPEEDLIVAIPSKKLAPGAHILTISVKDRSGNITRRAVNFSIQ